MAKKIWAGLDVGVETTSVCIIDDNGQVLHEAVCPSALKSIHGEIGWLRRRRFARVGIESGAGVSLARGLRTLGYAVDVYEARQLSKFLRVRRNKTDAGDANGIAEAGRVGASVVSKVYLKSLECQSLQSRLTIRRHLIRERVAAVSLLCRQLELYGGRIRPSSRGLRLRQAVEPEMRKLFDKEASSLTRELEHLLNRCEAMIVYQQALDDGLRRLAFNDELCRRLMAIPGIGPICALTSVAAVGEPQRFHRTANVGSYFGLTPTIHQSGLTTRVGRISRMGSSAVRGLLVQAAITFMRSSAAGCELRDWAAAIQERRGSARARVALARKLAIVMLAMWKTGECYKPRTTTLNTLLVGDEPDPEAPIAPCGAGIVVGPALPVNDPEDDKGDAAQAFRRAGLTQT
jgi:transposase